MTWTIRALHPDDYVALAICYRAAMPGADDTAESLQEDDRSSFAMQRWVAVKGGRVVGTASWFQIASRLHPRKFWMDGAVHPESQGRGIGSALLETVVAAVTAVNAVSLRTATREDYTQSRRFLEGRGFVEAKRSWESFLDLHRFDIGPWAGRAEAAEAKGIQLRQLSELQHLPDWEERLLALYNAIQTFIPDFDEPSPLTLEQFRNEYVNSPLFLPEGYFVALDGDRWIGLSNLCPGAEEGEIDTGVTGVLPGYRRRGIALALKLKALVWAKARGAARIRTVNATTNQAMLAINERLGFEKRPAWLHMLLTFSH